MLGADIFRARARLRGRVPPTPLVRHPLIDAALGAEVFIKLENTTPIGSFKIRGGINLCVTLTEHQRSVGICAPTRGNHGQALAYACQEHDMRCTLFVPVGNNPDKNRAMRAFGAEVVEIGGSFDETHQAAERFASETGACYVHPGREPALIAGAGTLALEMVDQLDAGIDVMFVPVGVGSCAAGVALAMSLVSPDTRIYGVAAAAAPAMYEAFYSGSTVCQPAASTLADGLAVGESIELTLGIMRQHLAGMLLVEEHELASAVRLYARGIHQLAEGAGAAGLAGALQMKDQLAGARVGLVLSGGNIDSKTLAGLLDEAAQVMT